STASTRTGTRSSDIDRSADITFRQEASSRSFRPATQEEPPSTMPEAPRHSSCMGGPEESQHVCPAGATLPSDHELLRVLKAAEGNTQDI
ncbi:unnamed protein product, partial [Amoebophrya sp. A25]